jgi:hypothetical protein
VESFRHVPFRSVRRVPSSTLAHVSASPPTIPDGRLSRVRFWPRLCTPFFGDSSSCNRRSLSCSLASTPPRHSSVVPSSQLLRGCLPALCLGSLRGHQDHRVPRAPLPGMGVTHRQGDLPVTSEGVTPPSSLLRAHASDRHPLPASVVLGQGVYAGCRESLLDGGPSRHYLCHLCVGAWTHTPPCSSDAHAHLFSDDSGLTSRETRSAHGRNPARRFPQGALYRGCSHSLMFRLPHSLDLQIVPTAVHRLGGQAVYTTHRPRGYPPQDVVSLRVCMGI